MTLTLQRVLGFAIICAILAAGTLLLGNQRQAHADSLAAQIVCRVFTQLHEVSQGARVPFPVFRSGCGVQGSVEIIKVVNGGVAVPANFQIHLKSDGTDIMCGGDACSPMEGTSDGRLYGNLSPAIYNVSESGGPSGYTASFSGDCSSHGDVTIVSGVLKQCTITNTFHASPPGAENTLALCSDSADNDADSLRDLLDPDCATFIPTLTIVKRTVGGDGAFGFTLTGATRAMRTISTSAGVATSSLVSLSVGTTLLSEDAIGGWNQTGLHCVSAGANITASVPGGAQIGAHIGDSVFCTFTNTKQSSGGSAPQCSDGGDNDSDGKTDSADPGCHSDFDASNASSYDANRSNEAASVPVLPTPSACSDGIDNDGDNLVDIVDPGCNGGSDDDESNTASSAPSSGGGGGGGGRGSGPPIGTVFSFGPTGGAVLGVATDTPPVASNESCDKYLTAFIKSGARNDEGQVRRLQYVLRDFEGAKIDVNGTYDGTTLAAVHALQTKYAGDILTPWGITQSTGFTYLTTRKKINEVYCRNTKQFPLTSTEQQTIDKARPIVPISVSVPTKPAVVKVPRPAVEKVREAPKNFWQRILDTVKAVRIR